MGIFEFFVVMLTAITVENVVFARALGLSGTIVTVDSPKEAFSHGVVYTWLTLLSGLGAVFVRYLTELYEFASLVHALILMALVILSYVMTYFLSKGLFPRGSKTIHRILPINAFNTALFGVLYIMSQGRFTLGASIAYSFGAGIGYTLAILIVLAAKRRLSLSPIPRSFRGVPILLVYLGMLSLALYGLLGRGLPS